MERLQGALPGDLINALAFDPNYIEAAKTNKNLPLSYCFKEILIKSLLSSMLLLEILIYIYCQTFSQTKVWAYMCQQQKGIHLALKILR